MNSDNHNIDINEYMPTIKYLAQEAHSAMRKPTMDSVDDLIQDICVLFYEKIVTNFQKRRNVKFKTYMVNCIKNYFKSKIQKSYIGIDVSNEKRVAKSPTLMKILNPFTRDGIINTELQDFLANLDIIERRYITLISEHQGLYVRKKVRKIMGISRFYELKIRNSIKEKWNR